jgi:type I restriction-modification system DNA methylase subunit
LWIITKFNVLPTDDRFLNLYPEQKEALFYGLNELLPLEAIRERLFALLEYEELCKKPLKSFDPENRINNLKKIYKAQKMTDEEIDKLIKDRLTLLRKTKIEEKQKELGLK